MATVARLFRHPLKAVGAEEIAATDLLAGRTLPWDRVWAVADEAAKLRDGWNPCNNFVRGVKSHQLMAVSARTDEATGRITLGHPDRPEITLDPETEGDALIDWIRPLCDPNRAQPVRVVRAPDRGMTDSDFPSVSILGLSSLRALSDKLGRPLDPRRFRGNVWLEDTGPWEEFEWIGRRLQLGGAILELRERITRCRATTVNPETGRSDAETLDALEDGWGHMDFGVYGVVLQPGRVAVGDPAWLV